MAGRRQPRVVATGGLATVVAPLTTLHRARPIPISRCGGSASPPGTSAWSGERGRDGRLPARSDAGSTTCCTCAPPNGRSWRRTRRSATCSPSGFAGAGAGVALGPALARPRALGRVPQRRHARAQQRVRPRRRRHRLSAPAAAAATPSRRVRHRTDGCRARSCAFGLPRAVSHDLRRVPGRCRWPIPSRPSGSRRCAGADWIINMVGFGTLTPYAGWAATGVPDRARAAAVLLGVLPPVRGTVPAHPDLSARGGHPPRRPHARLRARRRRGASRRRSARRPSAFGLFAAAAVRAGWRGGGTDLWRWGGLLLALAAWAAVLIPWRRELQRDGAGRARARHVPRARRVGA